VLQHNCVKHTDFSGSEILHKICLVRMSWKYNLTMIITCHTAPTYLERVSLIQFSLWILCLQASDDFEVKPLALTAQSLDPRGLYIYDDGFNFIIWFGSMLPSDLTNNLLGNFSGFPDLSKVIFFVCSRFFKYPVWLFFTYIAACML